MVGIMGLLKHIKLEIELYPMYSRIFAEYEFDNNCGRELAASFIFPVPGDAVITGINKMGADKRLVRASVKPMTEQGFADSGMRIIRLNSQLYRFDWGCVKPDEKCTVLAEMLVLLKAEGGKIRLNIPLGQEAYSGNSFFADGCMAEITVRSQKCGLRCSSPTHNVTEESTEQEILFCLETNTGRDAVLEFDGFGHSSMGVVGGGVGFYRVSANDKAVYGDIKEENRVILLADVSKQPKLIKEFIVKAVQSMKNERRVQIFLGREKMFADFRRADEMLCDELLRVLSTDDGIPCGATEFAMLLSEADLTDIDVIMVTADSKLGMEMPFDYYGLSQPINVFLISEHAGGLGEYRESGSIDYCEHFYPNDITTECIALAISRIAAQKSEIRLTADGYSVTETIRTSDSCMAADGHMDIAVRYNGIPPERFTVWENCIKKETIQISRIEACSDIYNLEVLYTGIKIKELSALQKRLGADSCFRIKKEIETLGVKYGIITSETMLEVEMPTGRTACIPAIFYLGGADDGITTGRESIFRESGLMRKMDDKTKRRLIAFCVRILKCAIHSDGAIADEGCFDEYERACRTAFAAAALQLTEYRSSPGGPEFAFKYLKKNPPSGFAMQLYLHRDRLSEFMTKNSQAVLKELPDCDELLNQLKNRNERVYAAARLILALA